MIEQVFKLVLGDSNLLSSAIMQASAARVIYEKEEWATAWPDYAQRGYHLTCFRDKDRAIEYALAETEHDVRIYSLWEATAQEITEHEDLPIFCNIFTLKPMIGSSWPYDTIMARNIMLKKRVGIVTDGRISRDE